MDSFSYQTCVFLVKLFVCGFFIPVKIVTDFSFEAIDFVTFILIGEKKKKKKVNISLFF